ncbi:MAG: hypothetical protein EOM54_00345 [Clostridia bacterium]|nr:hypothetical protein [Clostridia bacterium]
MYYSLTALAAVLVSLMVAMNAGLSASYGLHLSTLIIHAVGLLFATIAVVARKEKLFSARGLAAVLFTGGVIGYFTILFNNIAAEKISVAAILALSLLGQSITSLVIDQFGFFGTSVRKLTLSKLAGLAMAAAGIVFLLSGASSFAFVPVFVSLLTGITVVTSRSVNAELAARTSVVVSTWYNYATGFAVSAAALLVAAISGAGVPAVAAAPPVWAYLGGAVGAVVILLLNISVPRMSSFAMTLFMFAGQVFGGVAIDAFLFGEFSWRSLLGGAFAFLGVLGNAATDARAEKRAKAHA